MNLPKSSWCHKVFLPLCSTGAAVPDVEMTHDTLKVSLIKLAAAHRSSSFASAANQGLTSTTRQHFFSEHFEMYLPRTDTYLAHANTGESLMENNWMLSIQYVVLGLRENLKKALKCWTKQLCTAIDYVYCAFQALSWIFSHMKTYFVSLL